MKVKIEFTTDSAAFSDNPDEISWILNVVTSHLADGFDEGAILDSNGNTVGTYRKG